MVEFADMEGLSCFCEHGHMNHTTYTHYDGNNDIVEEGIICCYKECFCHITTFELDENAVRINWIYKRLHPKLLCERTT